MPKHMDDGRETTDPETQGDAIERNGTEAMGATAQDETKSPVPEGDARADAADDNGAPAETPTPRQNPLRALTARWCGMPTRTRRIITACVGIGATIGAFVIGTNMAAYPRAIGAIDPTTADPNTVMATYSVNGTKGSITLREALDYESLSAEEGQEQSVPTADSLISCARNRILEAQAKARGIEVSDDDALERAKESLGTKDTKSLAEAYGVTEDQVLAILHQNATTQALRDEVCAGATQEPKAPERPQISSTGEDGKPMSEDEVAKKMEAESDKPSKKYADYIIALVGDEWDAENDTWAAKDGPYAQALAKFQISSKAATYNAAQEAYYVAWLDYQQKDDNADKIWSDYMKDLYTKCDIQIATLN